MLAVLAPRTTPALPARAALAVLAGLLVLAACGSAAQASRATARGPAAPSGCRTVSRPSLGARTARKPAALLASSKHYDVTLVTNCGSFTFRIDQAESPHAAAAFVALVQHGFFNRTIFHRIVPGFVIQGGGLTADLTPKKTRAPIKNEASNGLKNRRGSLSMARTNDPNSATSQFFVNLKDNAFLDPGRGTAGYAVFAHVMQGLEVVDKIAAVATGTRGHYEDVPVEPVVLESVTVVKG
jgi:cyclophilin family peptidyl-prolyl cis-trans isomerase